MEARRGEVTAGQQHRRKPVLPRPCSTTTVISIILLLLVYVFSSRVLRVYRMQGNGQGWLTNAMFDEPSPAQKQQLDEVAELMLKIYQTLVDMCYLDAEGIQVGPHDITSMLPVYKLHGLDPALVYLYKHLPYVDTFEAGRDDFIFGGSFADYRRDWDVERGRDPLFASPSRGFNAENGEYMRPWVTALTNMGNHQSVIIYDTKQHRIWIVDQEIGSSTDLALTGVPNRERRSRNRNSFAHIPSRPATIVLKDIVRWYRDLDMIPGDGERSGIDYYDYEALKALYLKHGWPDHFDAHAFQVDGARRVSAADEMYHAEEPLRKSDEGDLAIESWGYNVEIARKQLAEASSEDAVWFARFCLWKEQRIYSRALGKFQDVKERASRLCPGRQCLTPDQLLLREVENLRDTVGH